MRYVKFFIIFAFLFLFTVGNLYAAEYIAFSLKVAQDRIANAPKRKPAPEVLNLGGITAIKGLVYDRETGDIILVGEKDPDRATLTLDDFVVALRARFIHNKWPLVSIDPTEETKKTNIQIVRFEGGIEDTQFGEDLFDADYRLKRIGMGLLSPGVPNIRTYWDIGMESAKEGIGKRYNIGSRFWFYPVLPSVSVREDVVAIKGLKVGVFTEVLSAEIDGKKVEDLSTFQDVAGDIFAKGVSENFESLGRVHPSFLRLQGLDELVALTKAIEEMDKRPDLSFWIKGYEVRPVKTKRVVEVLKRREDYERSRAGMVYRGYHEVSGGVQLMAIALRLKAGDVTALKEAVLKTRPKPGALSWSFVVGEWLIPTTPGMLQVEDVVPLFTQAVFLQENKRYDDAITIYGKVIELKPDWDWPYNNRGVAYDGKGEYDRAISDYNKALEINPRDAKAYNNRGAAFAKGKGEYDRAISDFNKALEINPRLAEAYNSRGLAYAEGKGRYDQAISDYNKALEINPRLVKVYNNRGNAYYDKGQYDRAISDYNKALEINPRDADAYNNRGTAYDDKGQYDRAISDYNKALEINPRLAEAYHNRGLAYKGKGRYDQAISDYNKALEINPRYAKAYFNKALSCERTGRIREAIEAYKGFIANAPPQYAPYIKKVQQRIREMER